MAKARNCSAPRTAALTFLCGVGHVGGSVVLGLVGIAAGLALRELEFAESCRGKIAAWLLTAFGLVYCAWGLRRAIRNRPHTHRHAHAGDVAHEHDHTHHAGHVHVHAAEGKTSLTPWVLFAIFVFGPCEPLIPVLMYPAAARSISGVVIVATVFAVTTIGTMLVMVLLGTFGLKALPVRRLERYSHALAGAAVFLCGVAIHVGL